jgi:hypothetical protein
MKAILSEQDFRAMFPRASADTIAANTKQNATTANVERNNGNHEDNPHPQLQDPEQCEQTPALGSESEGKASGARRPIVGFTLFRVNLLDWEAKYGSVKDLLDGLRFAGLIRGDREDQIDPQSYVRQVKVAHRCEEKTVIEITLAETICTVQ